MNSVKKNPYLCRSKIETMRFRFLLIKFFFFCVAFGVVAFKPDILKAQNQEVVIVGELYIFTEPDDNAEVFIDGDFVGHTPFMKKVEVGKHELTVKKDLYYDHHETIMVGDIRTDLKIKMKPRFGMIKIDTKPYGAVVSFNGIYYPTLTPCISGKISAGDVNVKIELEDYRTIDSVVTVKEGKISILNVKMEKQNVYESMTREMYDYQLGKVYNTNEDRNVVVVDTAGLKKVYASVHGNSPVPKYVSSRKPSNMPTYRPPRKSTYKPRKSPDVLLRTYAQNLKKRILKRKPAFWVKGGLGLSHVYGKGENGEKISWSTGDYYSNYPTFYIGGQFTARFNRYVGLAIDLNYSRTGYKYYYSDVVVEFNNMLLEFGVINKYIFNGVELPVVARAYFFENGLGPMVELGGIVNYKKYYNLKYTASTGEEGHLKEKYDSFNWGLVAGAGYDFKLFDVVCSANARVVMEMSRVFGDVDHKLIYFQFGVGVKIF